MDFPAFGNPINPTSATVFNSKTTLLSVPGSPGSYSPAVFPTGKFAFPFPPLPPIASLNSSSCVDKSASTRQMPYLYPLGRKCAVLMYPISNSSSSCSPSSLISRLSPSSLSSSSLSSRTGSEDPQFAIIFFVTSTLSSTTTSSLSSSSQTTVPTGTSITFVFPRFPCILSFPPFPPFSALNKFPT